MTHNRESLHVRWFVERTEETTLYLASFTPAPQPLQLLGNFQESSQLEAMAFSYDKVRIGKNVTTFLPGNFLRFMGRLRSIETPDRERIRATIVILRCNMQSCITRYKGFPAYGLYNIELRGRSYRKDTLYSTLFAMDIIFFKGCRRRDEHLTINIEYTLVIIISSFEVCSYGKIRVRLDQFLPPSTLNLDARGATATTTK